MKYIFIDTSLFIDSVTSNDSEKILNFLFKLLSKKNVTLVLPDVIKAEILSQYTYWKEGVIEKIQSNLDTKRILGIKEELTEGEKKSKKKEKGETEANKINSVIEPHRKIILKKIESYYKSIAKKLGQIFKHKNTKIIQLTERILFAGMKRSLLKRAPYTRTEKTTENPHTKDVDCIAFEAVATFCKKSKKTDTLVMCVADKDFFSKDGGLHEDIKESFAMNKNFYKTIPEMLSKEFQINIDSKKSKKDGNAEGKIGSLVGGNEISVESSKLINP